MPDLLFSPVLRALGGKLAAGLIVVVIASLEAMTGANGFFTLVDDAKVRGLNASRELNLVLVNGGRGLRSVMGLVRARGMLGLEVEGVEGVAKSDLL